MKKFNTILEDCPRMVPVFMVNCHCEYAKTGDLVYWSWNETLVSRQGEVKINKDDLDFIGYAPIRDLHGEAWPNVCKLMHIEGE